MLDNEGGFVSDDRPLLYDLYSRAGGASFGYMQAGFRVIGIDWEPQPRHRGDGFIRMDCIEFLARYNAGEFERAAAFHASPPCQAFCSLRHLHPDKQYSNLIPATREGLIKTGLPYVIENVAGARKHLINPVMLCGTMFRLGTPCGAELQRHRYFETNWLLMCGLVCDHGWASRVIMVTGDAPRDFSVARYHKDEDGNRRVISVAGVRRSQ